MFYYVHLGLYYETLDLTKTKVLLNLGSIKFCDLILNLSLSCDWLIQVQNSVYNRKNIYLKKLLNIIKDNIILIFSI